ncbi:hypothetical protein BC829DRAFT_177938 [Chytridium lagenaria]|nr:hypothetical protein BC829DRAFT_177938 [Chytridium lagenaria]
MGDESGSRRLLMMLFTFVPKQVGINKRMWRRTRGRLPGRTMTSLRTLRPSSSKTAHSFLALLPLLCL